MCLIAVGLINSPVLKLLVADEPKSGYMCDRKIAFFPQQSPSYTRPAQPYRFASPSTQSSSRCNHTWQLVGAAKVQPCHHKHINTTTCCVHNRAFLTTKAAGHCMPPAGRVLIHSALWPEEMRCSVCR